MPTRRARSKRGWKKPWTGRGAAPACSSRSLSTAEPLDHGTMAGAHAAEPALSGCRQRWARSTQRVVLGNRVAAGAGIVPGLRRARAGRLVRVGRVALALLGDRVLGRERAGARLPA